MGLDQTQLARLYPYRTGRERANASLPPEVKELLYKMVDVGRGKRGGGSAAMALSIEVLAALSGQCDLDVIADKLIKTSTDPNRLVGNLLLLFVKCNALCFEQRDLSKNS